MINLLILGVIVIIFYSYLHTSTLQDIQDKGICVCGHVITENSEEFDRLESLKKFALPIESAQHLNLIDQKFKQCAELPNLIEKLTIIKNDIRESKKNIADWKEDVHKISQDILKIEKTTGVS